MLIFYTINSLTTINGRTINRSEIGGIPTFEYLSDLSGIRMENQSKINVERAIQGRARDGKGIETDGTRTDEPRTDSLRTRVCSGIVYHKTRYTGKLAYNEGPLNEMKIVPISKP